MPNEPLRGKRIILGITGSVAAIKSVALARLLVRQGAGVFPIVTPNALEFTSEEDLISATGNPVIQSIFASGDSPEKQSSTWHVHLGRSADAMLIAPCSATTLGKLRGAIYDNPVTLLAASLERTTPLFLAPAMDEDMWNQPAVREAVRMLRSWDVSIIGPEHGALASGLIGMGRMTEPGEIVRLLGETLSDRNRLRGKRILVTGGPTYEAIDAVRFLSNRSSGKMAAALAEASARMGADVTLVMGPSSVDAYGIRNRIDVESAEEMFEAVMREFPNADVVIMNAAVSDFAPVLKSDEKIKKREGEAPAIALRRTPDILSEIAKRKRDGQIIVGFALEKGDRADAYARAKLEEKNLDMIVLNNIEDAGAGFGFDTNKVTIYTHAGTGKEELPLLTKAECARSIVNHIKTLLPE